MRTPSRSVDKHLPAVATAMVVLWLVAVYIYAIGGTPASAGRVGPKRLVKTALGGKAPRRTLEKRSRPVTVDVQAAATSGAVEQRNVSRTSRDRAEAGTKTKKTTKEKRRRAPATGHSLPVAPRFASGEDLREPHHDYPALDLALDTGTRVLAVTDGKVKATTRWGACGKGVIVRGRDDFTYTYCHGNRLQVGRGRRVVAGQTIMRSGSTGDSTGPHLHLQIRRPDGKLVCPQDVLPAWSEGKAKSPWKAKRHGCQTGKRHHDGRAKDSAKGKGR